MSARLNTNKRSAFIARDSTRISYKGPWTLGATMIDEDNLALVTQAGNQTNNVSSFHVEFTGSGYALHTVKAPSSGGAAFCTLDGQSIAGADCTQLNNLSLGRHSLNVTMRPGVMLHGVEYYLPYGPGEDYKIFEEPGIADYTNVWMYATDRNVSWHTETEPFIREDDGLTVVPQQANAAVSVEFYGSELIFGLRSDDVNKWRYELDGRAVPSISEYVRFGDLCLGTHSLIVRYEPQGGVNTGRGKILLPFNVSQPAPWSTATVCPDSASGSGAEGSSPSTTVTATSARHSGALIGGVVGGVVALLLLVLLVFLRMRRARRRAYTAASVAPTSQVFFPVKYASSITKGSIAELYEAWCAQKKCDVRDEKNEI